MEALIEFVRQDLGNPGLATLLASPSFAFIQLMNSISMGMYLFIIAAEVLAISVRARNEISGVKIGQAEFKLSQMADDTTSFLSDFQSVPKLLSCLDDFRKISGLKINLEKTLAMCVGSLSNTDPPETFNIKWTKGPIHTLGVTISSDPETIDELNFMPRLTSILQVLNIWKQRSLSLKGRVTILKALIIPKMLYVASNMPVTENVVEKMNHLISDFIWNSKRPKIKNNVIIQTIDKGGIKVPDFTSMVKASKIAWLKRLLQSDGK